MQTTVPKDWVTNLNNSIGQMHHHHTIKIVFSSILELTVKNDWRGACHESCGAIHILLNELNIPNTWFIGEVKVGEVFFDHSWIEIDSKVFDVAICKPLQPEHQSSPVINDIDLATSNKTTSVYGVRSGHQDDPMTNAVKNLSLSNYLLKSPIAPGLGTWALIDNLAKQKLNVTLDIQGLIKKYQGQFYSTKP